jgi:hypothetical protein
MQRLANTWKNEPIASKISSDCLNRAGSDTPANVNLKVWREYLNIRYTHPKRYRVPVYTQIFNDFKKRDIGEQKIIT